MMYGNGAQRVLFSCQCLGPQHVAAGANFLLSQRPVWFVSSSSLPLWMPKSGSVPEEWGPEYPPTSSDRGQGLGPSSWLRKSLPGLQVPSVRGSCEPLLAGPEPGNFPLSRPPSCSPPWLPLSAVSVLVPGLKGERAPTAAGAEEPIPTSCCQRGGNGGAGAGRRQWLPR